MMRKLIIFMQLSAYKDRVVIDKILQKIRW